jgi:hypothetical protein|tara:strand:- start:490 stop:933 length:444 start_codon:yes stop_codon:yes gene_type:complete
MLYKFTNTNKYGNLRHRIIYRPNGEGFKFNPKGFGPFVNVEVFKYTYEHPILPPSLFTGTDGQKFITPTWQKVLPETTLEDINWVKPELKVTPTTSLEYKFESKSDPGSFYIVRVIGDKVKCNCAGQYRAKDRQCKHMKEVKQKLGL